MNILEMCEITSSLDRRKMQKQTQTESQKLRPNFFSSTIRTCPREKGAEVLKRSMRVCAMLANSPGTVERRAPMSVSDMRTEAEVRIAAGSDSPCP